MCFPIDQLPLSDNDGSTLPLYERVSVSLLSSPRELLRDATVKKLQDSNVGDETEKRRNSHNTGTSDSFPSPVDGKAGQTQLQDCKHDPKKSELEKSTSSVHPGNGIPITELEVGCELIKDCLLYTSPSPRDATLSRMPSSA